MREPPITLSRPPTTDDGAPRPVALVTGAARRLGRALAETLARRGFDLALHAHRSHRELAAFADELRALSRRVWTFGADLSHPAAAARLAADALAAAGPISVLVNNASAFPADTLADFDPARWRALHDLHVLAPLVLARAVAAGGAGGLIVNVTDARTAGLDRRHFSYWCSKRLLAELTPVMALAFAPDWRVNALAPGPVLAPEGEGPEYLAALAPLVPLGRTGAPADVTDALEYLLDAPAVTGQTLALDGGRHLKGRNDG